MIRGTYGRGGSGKSLFTVRELYRLWKLGRDVFANTPLVDLRVREVEAPAGRLWVPVDPVMFGESWAAGYLDSFEDLYTVDNCEVLLDELGSWLPSHLFRQVPEEVRQFLAQDRREGVNIHWTHRTTRVFHEVLDNTAELRRCERYGPFVRVSCYDPQDRASKPVVRWLQVNPLIYDLYDTLARVGSPRGEAAAADDQAARGYGTGRRATYGGKKSGAYFVREFRTLQGRIIRAERQLTYGQAQCVIRKFGPEAAGLVRAGSGEGPVLPSWSYHSPDEGRHVITSPSWSGLAGMGRESYC